MNKKPQNSPPTFESVWAALQETDRVLSKKFDKTRRYIQASAKKAKEDQAAFEKRWEKSELKTKKLEELMGSWANNQGRFAEEYFSNSFKKGKKNFFGEKFNKMSDHVKGIESEDEYDILLINGKSVGIIEVKFKAHVNDIPKILNKTTTFRINFPKYENHQVYLGLATMAFYPELEQECINQGIAIIKQVGDNVVINDAHLKVF